MERLVLAGLTLTPMAGIGFFNWMDLTVAIPLVAWQTGANLRDIGSEGSMAPLAVGDMRISARASLPYFNRKDEVARIARWALDRKASCCSTRADPRRSARRHPRDEARGGCLRGAI
jgi:hypothetical protein